MANTKDNNKKKQDNQAHQERKNEIQDRNIKNGSRQYSKKTDHI